MNIQDVLPEPEWTKPVMFYGKPLTFNPRTHRYTWDGRHVPSVTTILRRLDKPQLVQWAANCAVDHIKAHIESAGTVFEALAVLEEARKAHTVIRYTAGDVGTATHKHAHAVLAGSPVVDVPLADPQAQKAVAAFQQWHSQHRIQPIALERRVMSAELMYAGTCDFYGIIDDEPALLDFKTGNGVYDEAWYQLAGYEYALREELNPIARTTYWVVHLNKNTGECVTYKRGPDETTKARDVWMYLVHLDKAIRAMPKMERRAA